MVRVIVRVQVRGRLFRPELDLDALPRRGHLHQERADVPAYIQQDVPAYIQQDGPLSRVWVLGGLHCSPHRVGILIWRYASGLARLLAGRAAAGTVPCRGTAARGSDVGAGGQTAAYD
ncbi:MAG TPA: hypothetical protein VIM49_07035 [Dermatophilaceae bacterium]